MSVQATIASLARVLAWAMWWGGWLALGELGRRFTPLWMGGLLPLALWLTVTAVCTRLSARRAATRRTLTVLLAATAAILATLIARSIDEGSAAALLLAATTWGVLTVAADRAARASESERATGLPDPVHSAIGAFVAWMLVGVDAGLAPVLVLSCGWGLAVCALACNGGRVHRSCGATIAMPISESCLMSGGSTWQERSLRAVMLPMMASLVLMPDWCAQLGFPNRPGAAAAIHLAAMLAPACLLSVSGVRLTNTAWPALLLAASVVLLSALPGAAGWAMASLAQSVAWSLGYASSQARPQHAVRGGRAGWACALLPAGWLCALGCLESAWGWSALIALYAGLGAFGSAAALLSLVSSMPQFQRRWE